VRIKIFERDSSLRHLLKLICQWGSNNVEVADTASACPAYTHTKKKLTCCNGSRTILIIDAHLSPVSGLDWVENQSRSSCQVPSDNKLILATHWTDDDLQRAERLGCHTLRKPFKTRDVVSWLQPRLKS
jgi:DNA-binding response OmpR family regulator